MLDIEPKKATSNNRNNLSNKVASVTRNKEWFLKTKARPKYSPILAGVKTPAENP